jgi:hypothetical protein
MCDKFQMIWTLAVDLVHEARIGLPDQPETGKSLAFDVHLKSNKMFTRALDYAILFGLATVFDLVVFTLRVLRPSSQSRL